MRAVLWAGDSIYRIGGEEILVVLPGATEADAIGIAVRLRQAVRKRRPAGVGVAIMAATPSSSRTDGDSWTLSAAEIDI